MVGAGAVVLVFMYTLVEQLGIFPTVSIFIRDSHIRHSESFNKIMKEIHE